MTTDELRTRLHLVDGESPVAFLVHPNDWEDLDWENHLEGYYFGNQGVPANIAGVPVVESDEILEGTAWTCLVIWHREKQLLEIKPQSLSVDALADLIYW